MMNEKIKQYIEENIPKTIRFNKEDSGNLIGLPKPYNVPSVADRFQEMYYWDTYFLNRGLIIRGDVVQAKNNAENMFFLIEKYGFMPNGNRLHYLHNSQPPFLSMMVYDIFNAEKDKQWLKKAYDVLCLEYDFWMTKRISPIGLNMYTGNIQMAIEEKMFSGFLDRIGNRPPDISDEKLSMQYVAICESGWDINPRFDFHVEDFCEVELNALMFGFEKNMAEFADILDISGSDIWRERAEKRKTLMSKYMLDNGIFYDYDFTNGVKSDKFTCASLYPLLVGMADKKQAEAIKINIKRLETEYGLAVTEKAYDEGKYTYQWQYPNGWAPMYSIAINALDRYGFTEDAKRIAKKYKDLVERNFSLTGNLWEKYNVVTGGIDVADESSERHATMPPMIGWTAGVYIESADYLERHSD
ncbi:MAG: alpha,alpha-trehalase [Clostridia bacterium]|nr:alpha,alpha-trehalase [Clostridia bacterium]